MPRPPVITDKKKYTIEELSAIWDADDPTSIPRVLPGLVAEKILNAYKARPDLFKRNEHELLQDLMREKATPTVVDRRIRLSFWEEYNRVTMSHGDAEKTIPLNSMNMENVVRGVCHKSYFTGDYISSPQKVAFMVCPPASYLKATEEALIFGIDQLRDILALDNFTDVLDKRTGKIKKILNTKLLEVKAKITLTLAHQAKGSIVNHKVESKNLHIVGGVGSVGPETLPTARQVRFISNEMSMEEIDRKLNQIRERAKRQSDLLKLEGQREEEYKQVFDMPEENKKENLESLIEGDDDNDVDE